MISIHGAQHRNIVHKRKEQLKVIWLQSLKRWSLYLAVISCPLKTCFLLKNSLYKVCICHNWFSKVYSVASFAFLEGGGIVFHRPEIWSPCLFLCYSLGFFYKYLFEISFCCFPLFSASGWNYSSSWAACIRYGWYIWSLCESFPAAWQEEKIWDKSPQKDP